MTRLRKVRSYLILIYVMVLLLVFPLAMHNRYYDLTVTKYYFFIMATAVAFAGTLVFSFIILLKEKNYLSNTVTSFIQRLTASDFFLLSFLIISVCSCFNSAFRSYAITGKEGRYFGLVMIAACVISFFMIGRLLVTKKALFYVFCAAGCIVFLLGIGQHFGLDPLGIQAGLDNHNRSLFYSTIGNRNVLSSFIILVLGISSALYCFEEKRRAAVIYLITSAIGFIALFTCDSDSGFLAVSVLFYTLPFFYKRNNFSLIRYLILLCMFFITAKVTGLLCYYFPTEVQQNGAIQKILFYNPVFYIIIAVLIIAVLVLLYRKKYYITNAKSSGKKYCAIWGAMGIAAALLIFGSVLWFSAADKTTDLGQASAYLRFDKNWGSGRGEVWIKAIETYSRFNPDHLLIGKGPDTAALILNPNYFFQMNRTLDSYFDNCHNEYIQYLITVGLLGVISYVGFLISTLYRLFRRKDFSPLSAACGLSVLCYACQAIVNINQAITTPFVFIIAGIGVGIINCNKANILIKLK